MKRLIQIEGDKIIRQIPLKKKQYTLGRGNNSDIVFDVHKVSRRHAVLFREGEDYWIIDKVSTNHVYVNGEQVEKRQLISGDEISLSRDLTLLYLSETEADERVGDLLNRMWNAINRKDFLRLKEVTRRIVSLEGLDNILKIVLEEVIRLVGAERGFIALADEEGNIRKETSAVCNLPLTQEGEDGEEVSIFSHSTVRRAIENRESVFIFTGNDEETLSQSIIALDLQSVMCSPLLFGDKLVAILYVDSGSQIFDFSETDQFFFAILADHAAIAIENAKLYSRVRMSLQELREEIHASEERYRHTLEAAPDSIIIIQIDDGHFIQINKAFCRIFGYAEEEALGRTAFELNLFSTPEDMGHIIEIVTAEHELKGFASQVRKRDGSVLYVLVSARFVEFVDEDCLIMVLTDL